jgi:DNA-directed RNA polymerase subunit RPC12/RpoP
MKGLNAEAELSVNFLARSFAFRKLTKVVSIREKFSNHFFFDPPIDKETSAPYSDILNALSTLEGWNYLQSSRSVTRYCVECFTVGLNLVGRCAFCGSTRIRRGKVLSHKCGYRGFEELFRQEDKYICPKCQKQLYIEGEDYRDESLQYKCMTCGNIFEKYATYYQCPSCHAYYEEEQAPSIEFVVYEPTSTLLSRRSVITNSFKISERVAQYLSKVGYVTKMYNVQEAKDDLVYWDLTAQKTDGSASSNIGVTVMPFYDKFDEELISTVSMKKDKSSYSSAMVITPAQADQKLISDLGEKSIFVLDSNFETLMDEEILKGYVVPAIEVPGNNQVETNKPEPVQESWDEVLKGIQEIKGRL